MEENVYITKNAKETQELAQNFAQKLILGDSVLLEGDLGSGKTTFVQGLAKALGIKKRIISPTFVLVRTYKGKLGSSDLNLYHVDLYRINDFNTVVDLGLSDMFNDESGITLIEWGQKSGHTKFSWKINLEAQSEKKRKITITSYE